MDSNRMYIDLLIESMIQKNNILDDIVSITSQQEKMLSANSGLSIEDFDSTTEDKGRLIDKLNELNDGFEALYLRVKDEILNNKNNYHNEINRLQELIKSVTEKSIRVQAIESCNRTKFELYLSNKKRDIKDFKISSKTASNYYKNMANQHQGQSYFLDKKK